MFQYGEFLVAKVLLAIPHTIMRMCEVKLRTSFLPLNTVSIICSAVLPDHIPACLPSYVIMIVASRCVRYVR